jgi:hypothetical protein
MARFSQIHLLLTYRCPFECEHCFVWGSPFQTGAMTIAQVREIFRQAEQAKGVRYVSIEGGEPFLYYATAVETLREAKAHGWRVELLTNAYWATSPEDARLWLRPLAKLGLDGLVVSADPYHGSENGDHLSPPKIAMEAARRAGIETSSISILPAVQSVGKGSDRPGQAITGGPVCFRGRAARDLVEGLPLRPWRDLATCPHEELAHPARMHFDPLGYVHICQGLVMGNIWRTPLKEMLRSYDAAAHPICGPLLRGGPAEIARTYGVPHEGGYVDECHMCYELRRALRQRFSEFLCPDQMYGVVGERQPAASPQR